MNKRIAQNDKVEIIDETSRYLGKRGSIIRIEQRPLEMINFAGKVTKSRTVTILSLKLEGNVNVEITSYPKSIEPQIKKLE